MEDSTQNQNISSSSIIVYLSNCTTLKFVYFKIGDDIVNGKGRLEIDGTQTNVTTTVNGVVLKMSVVQHDGTLYLFSPVRTC